MLQVLMTLFSMELRNEEIRKKKKVAGKYVIQLSLTITNT
jgi:hypothetical protein